MPERNVTVVNYGMGNIWSVRNALSFVGATVTLSSDPDEIARAECLVLPGVGVFGSAMRRLEALGVRQALDEAVCGKGVPFLGICIGMQLLADQSEESKNVPGLGWIPGKVLQLRGTTVRVPHMGFSSAHQAGRRTPLLENIDDGADFYFVHSYHFAPDKEQDVMLLTEHSTSVVSAVQRENIVGVQFHPEKSQSNGLQFLFNFLKWSVSRSHA